MPAIPVEAAFRLPFAANPLILTGFGGARPDTTVKRPRNSDGPH